MKLTSPLYSLKAWQTLSSDAVSKTYHVEGSAVFRRQSSYVVLERYYVPFNPRTSFQQEGRSFFKWAVASWQALPQESRTLWAYYQDVRRKYPIMSGYNLFISQFLLTKGDPKIPS